MSQIVPANHNISVSTNPHSLSQRGSIEIPDNGNVLVASYKRNLLQGMRGIAGLGGLGAGVVSGAGALTNGLGCCASGGLGALQFMDLITIVGVAAIVLPLIFTKKRS